MAWCGYIELQVHTAYFKNTGVVGIVSMYLPSRYPLLGLAFWLVM